MKYRMYSVIGPSTWIQDKITFWDKVACVFGWLNWIEVQDDEKQNV